MLVQSIAGQECEEMVARYQESPGQDLKDRIVVRCADMVKSIARRYAGIDLQEDLVQVGSIGLLKAIVRFDTEAGVQFNTYAGRLVAGEIRHHLRDKSQTIRQPSWVQQLRHRLGKALSVLQNRLNRAPSNRELADELGVSENSVEEVLAANCVTRIESLDAVSGGRGDRAIGMDLLSAAGYSPDQLGVEDRLRLEHAMEGLREIEKRVVGLYYFEELNQSEIANLVGISCNYVGQVLRSALSKISKTLGSEEQKDRILQRQSSNVSFEVIDEETGVCTESYFRNRLQEEVHRASANDSSVALVVVQFEGLDDLSRFDGRESVLSFLTEAGEFLRATVRRGDMVARLGETGFAVILPLIGAGASAVPDRLLQKTSSWAADRVLLDGRLTVHVGAAYTPTDGRSAAQLLTAALVMPVAETMARAL